MPAAPGAALAAAIDDHFHVPRHSALEQVVEAEELHIDGQAGQRLNELVEFEAMGEVPAADPGPQAAPGGEHRHLERRGVRPAALVK